MAGGDLVDQFGLDGGVVDRVGGVGRRDRDLGYERAAADDLVGPLGAAEVDDVGIVLGQPVDVGAVEDLLVECGDTGRGGIEDLCQVLAVAARRRCRSPIAPGSRAGSRRPCRRNK